MWGVEGIGEIRPGDVLADHIVECGRGDGGRGRGNGAARW